MPPPRQRRDSAMCRAERAADDAAMLIFARFFASDDNIRHKDSSAAQRCAAVIGAYFSHFHCSTMYYRHQLHVISFQPRHYALITI